MPSDMSSQSSLKKASRKVFSLAAPFLILGGTSYAETVGDLRNPTDNEVVLGCHGLDTVDETGVGLEPVSTVLTAVQKSKRYENAIKRADENMTPYYTVRTKQAYYEQYCAQIDYSSNQAEKTNKKLWQKLQKIKQSQSPLAQAIAKHMEQADLFVCEADLVEHNNGFWFSADDEGVLWMTQREISDEAFLDAMIHETFHSIQTDTKNGEFLIDFGVIDFLDTRLTIESTASVASKLVLFEMSLFNEIEWSPAKDTLSYAIEQSYFNAFDKGLSHKASLEQAGLEAFRLQFNNANWIDSYNASTMNHFIENYKAGIFVPSQGKGYDLNKARLSGYFSPQFNFMSQLKRIPDIGVKVGGRAKLAHAYNHMATEQAGQTKGKTSEEYKARRALLEQQNNPYMSVDLNWLDTKSGADLIEQMDYYASAPKQDNAAPKAPTEGQVTIYEVSAPVNICPSGIK